MRQHPYAKSRVLFYPGGNLTEQEKMKLDRAAMTVEEVRPEYIIHVLSNMFTTWMHSALEIMEEVAGRNAACKMAENLAARHTFRSWTSFLKSREVSHGSPELMAEWQDIAHTYRGPVHTGALFAEFDEEKCVVRREECIYYGGRDVGAGLYDGALCEGFMRGYMEADPAIEKIDRVRGFCYGHDSCKQIWWYKSM